MQCTASKMVGSYTLNSLKDGELCMQPIHSIHKIADSNARKMADSTVRKDYAGLYSRPDGRLQYMQKSQNGQLFK